MNTLLKPSETDDADAIASVGQAFFPGHQRGATCLVVPTINLAYLTNLDSYSKTEL